MWFGILILNDWIRESVGCFYFLALLLAAFHFHTILDVSMKPNACIEFESRIWYGWVLICCCCRNVILFKCNLMCSTLTLCWVKRTRDVIYFITEIVKMTKWKIQREIVFSQLVHVYVCVCLCMFEIQSRYFGRNGRPYILVIVVAIDEFESRLVLFNLHVTIVLL